MSEIEIENEIKLIDYQIEFAKQTLVKIQIEKVEAELINIQEILRLLKLKKKLMSPEVSDPTPKAKE